MPVISCIRTAGWAAASRGLDRGVRGEINLYTMLGSPSCYMQGRGILREIDRHLKRFGNRLLFVISVNGEERFGEIIRASFKGKPYEVVFVVSGKFCTMKEISIIEDAAYTHKSTAIIGVGGRGILDSAKAAAHFTGLPCVLLPTVASSSGPCSSFSIVSKEGGAFDRCIYSPDSVRLVAVDTEVIVNAPVRFFVAGMGNAMTACFEGRTCRESGGANQFRAKPTTTATEMAALCWKLLKEYGVQAKKDVENGECSRAFETIIEVNTYLSGIGSESGGLAGAHAVLSGLACIPELKYAQHGELAAFCTIVQLILEDAKQKEIDEILNFSTQVGLPVCFEDLGYAKPLASDLIRAALIACDPQSTMCNMRNPIGVEGVIYALKTADQMGMLHKQKVSGLHTD